ncbi:MAG: methyltransferase domain-containing protein [Candidatus Woesearchaeota archaeon]|jgi:ubiquinone/menaquinone biosynthesis C-methylase UbiE|nr:methyltransferase domain-containing protein [Candidatus Woesearchaeota archaeon]|tara:strand:- start:1816 stop:2283 length:468 start_codon:yes stop_codon:yes gene_type:complete
MIFDKIYRRLCIKKAKKICNGCNSCLTGNILDVGSGRCHIAKEISKKTGEKVQCLDVKGPNLTDLPLKLYNDKKIPFSTNSFDTTLLCYVLHHAKNPINLLKEGIRVFKKNIIIFKDNADNLLAKPLDFVYNKLYSVDAPLNFKNIDGWVKSLKN